METLQNIVFFLGGYLVGALVVYTTRSRSTVEENNVD
jgi:hypothetical protein